MPGSSDEFQKKVLEVVEWPLLVFDAWLDGLNNASQHVGQPLTLHHFNFIKSTVSSTSDNPYHHAVAIDDIDWRPQTTSRPPAIAMYWADPVQLKFDPRQPQDRRFDTSPEKLHDTVQGVFNAFQKGAPGIPTIFFTVWLHMALQLSSRLPEIAHWGVRLNGTSPYIQLRFFHDDREWAWVFYLNVAVAHQQIAEATPADDLTPRLN